MDWECFSQMIKGRCVFDSYVISSLMIITVTNARILIRYHEQVLFEYLLDMQLKRQSFVFRQYGYFNSLACYRTGSLTHGFQLVLFSNKLNYSASFSQQTSIFVFSVLGAVSRKPRKLFGPVKPLQNLEPCEYRSELFYSHILKMMGGSLRTRSFERIHFSVFRYRLSKNGFTGPKTFRGLRETGPGLKLACS